MKPGRATSHPTSDFRFLTSAPPSGATTERKGNEGGGRAGMSKLGDGPVFRLQTSDFRIPMADFRILRKEVIQPQVPLRLPCYDFTPVADPTVAGCLLAVSAPSSGNTNSHGVTGGVYKARERIHRSLLFCDY